MILPLVKGNDCVVAIEPQKQREGTAPLRRPRIAAAERERMILSEAIRFFADEGFDGQIRALAERIGITHSVLFRHFPSKEALIARVYQDVYVRRMRPEWTALLRDRSLPLAQRLFSFYREYTDAIFHRDWIRIFMFAGLKGVSINAPYLALLRETVLFPICTEVRAASKARRPPMRHFRMKNSNAPGGCTAASSTWRSVNSSMAWRSRRTSIRRCKTRLRFFWAAWPRNRKCRGCRDHAPARRRRRRQTRCRRAGACRPEQRERQIVDGAVGFFAEHGMDGQMRELAKRLGVTHPLLYRYFPIKEALIERVYEEVYVNRWKVEWEALLHDRAQPLTARLTAFYLQYADVIDRYEWIRIFVFAGLRGVDICGRYLELVRQRVIEPIAREFRLRRGAKGKIDARDVEIAWGLHGQIVYLSIRRWVYGVDVRGSREAVIAGTVAGVEAMRA